MDYVTIMDKLKGVSTRIAAYLDEEKYKPQAEWVVDDTTTLDDGKEIETGHWEMPAPVVEPTEQYILNCCYDILLDELDEMGIVFHCERTTILNNFYDAECIYLLKKFFNSKYLYTQLLSDRDLRDKVRDICERDTDRTLKIVLILELYMDRFSNDDDISRLYTTVHDKVCNTGTFCEHVLTVCASIPDMGFDDIGDPELAASIIANIEGTRTIAGVVFDCAMELDTTIDSTRLYRDLRKYNLDKILPSTINHYGWWLMVKNTELDDDEKKFWDYLNYTHNSHNNHHIEYYQLKPSDYIVNKEDMVNLVANFQEPEDQFDRGVIQSKLDRCIATLSATHTIQEEAIELARQLVATVKL